MRGLLIAASRLRKLRTAPRADASHNHRAPGMCTPSSEAASAPDAAMTKAPKVPSTRSTRITVIASVLDPAAGAVSLIRTTSPPMLLGRKLLKNMLTQIDSVSRRARLRCAARAQTIPSPHADRLRDRVGSERQQDPGWVHAFHAPRTREIDRAQHEYSSAALTLRRTNTFSSDESLCMEPRAVL